MMYSWSLYLVLLMASMKVPPKRKGNVSAEAQGPQLQAGLNESPSEKEGKSIITYFDMLREKSLNESPSEKEGKCPGKNENG